MKGFTPGLLDRLMDERRDGAHPAAPLGLEQFKDSVARDIEALLNTRIALDPARLAAYPRARDSILRYGLADFAGLCLTSSHDRAAVCASIEEAIALHEPRLREVRARLEPPGGNVNRLQFAIHARLVAGALAGQGETVDFSAVLRPSSLHYEIGRARPGPEPSFHHEDARWTST